MVIAVLVGGLVVAGRGQRQVASRTYTAPGGPTYAVGTVRFFRAEEGWGAITSPAVDADVWVHFSTIDMKDGLRALASGEPVEFRYHPERHDSWRYVASWVRPLTD